jgi:hypothetical protein
MEEMPENMDDILLVFFLGREASPQALIHARKGSGITGRPAYLNGVFPLALIANSLFCALRPPHSGSDSWRMATLGVSVDSPRS